MIYYYCGGKLSTVVNPCPFAPPRPVRSCHLKRVQTRKFSTVAGRGLLEERGLMTLRVVRSCRGTLLSPRRCGSSKCGGSKGGSKRADFTSTALRKWVRALRVSSQLARWKKPLSRNPCTVFLEIPRCFREVCIPFFTPHDLGLFCITYPGQRKQ